jgi:hypothetical protein
MNIQAFMRRILVIFSDEGARKILTSISNVISAVLICVATVNLYQR